MPELPEVETIVSQLKKKIVGKTVIGMDVFDALVDSRIKDIAPFKIKGVYRRAKYIVVVLDNQKFILIHLGMTGQFFFAEKPQVEEKRNYYQRFLVGKFRFSDGSILTHNSVRKIGSVRLVDEQQLNEVLSRLGPEPLSPNFTLEKFNSLLPKKVKANVKATLMDQHFLSGIGNIYAQEILYHAGISPLRKVGSLSPAEIKKLYNCIITILKKAIEQRGSSVDNYVHLSGEGRFQNYLAAYQQDYCPKRHRLRKLILGGRGTSYCPICQK